MAPISLRPATSIDFSDAAALCFRSKAYWGYDPVFMEACRNTLQLDPRLVERGLAQLAFDGERMAGVAQISVERGIAELELLFVDPELMGHGIGRVLYQWCVGEARRRQATRLYILADTGARGFYESQGAKFIRMAPSDVIADRQLPRLVQDLR